jgi:hypothetical protein
MPTNDSRVNYFRIFTSGAMRPFHSLTERQARGTSHV